MDKYEYQVCTEQIKQLINEKRFAEAMEIADTIDWRRVRSVSMLVTVSEIYKINKRYDDARDILLLAYEKHPTGKDIVYALCELAIKLNDIVQAIECYKEFCALAPGDPNSCILLYKIYKAQDVSLEEQIDVLEEFKSKEYIEKWAYELASLYHKTGQEAKCVAACDELILWFGEGKYVRKAMELKMQHTALSPDQQAKYDGRAATGAMPRFEQPYQNQAQFGNNAQQTGPMINQYAEYIQQTGDIYSTGQMYYQNGQPVQDAYGQPAYDPNQAYAGYDNMQGYSQGQYADGSQPVMITPDYYNSGNGQINVTPDINHLGMTQNIMVQSMGTGAWNTMDLQAQLAPQVMEVMQSENAGEYSAYNEETGIETSTAEPVEEPKEETTKEEAPKAPEISVHTGVIDISSADLPGQELPRLHETSDIMSKLAGVIPGTESASMPEAKLPDEDSSDNKEITDDTDNTDNTDNTEEIKEEAEKPETAEPDVINGGHSILTDNNEQVEISPRKISDDSTDEEIKPVEIPDKLPMPEIIKETEAAPVIPPIDMIERPDVTKTGELSEEIQRINNKAFGTKEPADVDIKEPVKAEAEIKPEKEIKSETPVKSEPEVKPDKPAEPEKEVIRVSDEKGQYPYDTVTDIGYVEEIPEIEQPDDIDDMLKTRELPLDQIEAYERDSMPEIDEFEIEDKDDDMPPFMRGNIRASREFDDDEYRIFCRYDGMEAMKAQLVSAMDLMSMDSDHGNIAIMGPQSADCKGIAINLVKAMQSKNPDFSGKVAKISGEALNKKDIKGTLKKLENGALIVESAGGLTKESILILTGVLTDEHEKVLVIIEGLREHIKPLFSVTKQMKTVFDARIDIADFTDDDLVNYGRGYALEKEYFIDDMGGLALHNRISEMQTYDHKVTVDEVRELVDNAIKHVDKKNMGHFMDMLLGRRYDDDDNIILSEKDFEF